VSPLGNIKENWELKGKKRQLKIIAGKATQGAIPQGEIIKRSYGNAPWV